MDWGCENFRASAFIVGKNLSIQTALTEAEMLKSELIMCEIDG